MLKTAATRIYWKQETKKSTVFSKFMAASLFPSVGNLCSGATYLRNLSTQSQKIIQTATHHSRLRTQKNAHPWTALVIKIWPMILANTFLDTRLAVGRF